MLSRATLATLAPAFEPSGRSIDMAFSNNMFDDRFGPDASDLELHHDAPAVHRQLAERGSIRKFQPDAVPDPNTAAAVRACAVFADQERSPAARYHHRRRPVLASPDLRAARDGTVGTAMDRCAAEPAHFLRQQSPPEAGPYLARQALRQRSSRCLLQCDGRRGDCPVCFRDCGRGRGPGTCPISAVRNQAAAVSRLLDLPDHVFPIAGLAVGYPAEAPQPSLRLPLSVTVHHNVYSEEGLDSAIDAYDTRRTAAQPYAYQRYVREFGTKESYGWSEDKARQYARPERQDFGAYVRAIGFKLE